MRYYLLIIAVCVFVACRPTPGKVFFDKSDPDSLSYYAALEMEGFSLPYTTRDFPDSNAFYFDCQPSFDTAYTIHIRKHGDTINGVVYEVPPINRTSLYEFTQGIEDVLAFEGYGFRLEPYQWQRLIYRADQIMKTYTADYWVKKSMNRIMRLSVFGNRYKDDHRCFDGTSYKMGYDGVTVWTGNCSDTLFDNLAAYLQKEILNDLHNKKIRHY